VSASRRFRIDYFDCIEADWGGRTFLAIEAMFVSELTAVREPLLNRPFDSNE
jgi:hypothetical protein